MYGLSTLTVEKIKAVLAKYHQVQEAILYGSRAKGISGPGSDIDLSLKGHKLNLHVLNKISHDLDDLLLPYNIDLSIYHRIKDQDLVNHIERVGKVFYQRQI